MNPIEKFQNRFPEFRKILKLFTSVHAVLLYTFTNYQKRRVTHHTMAGLHRTRAVVSEFGVQKTGVPSSTRKKIQGRFFPPRNKKERQEEERVAAFY
jgi:hypothetical protein